MIRRSPRNHAPVAALLVVAALAGCGRGSRRDAPDALLLTIDTTRGDRWGCLGDAAARTPHLDRLARGGVLAFEGRAPAPITLPSHTSMMTGLPPAVHGVRDNAIFRLPANSGRTLAESFRAGGYATAAFVSAFPLYPRFGLDRGFDHYDSRLGVAGGAAAEMRQRPAIQTVDRIREWLATPAAAGEGGTGPPPASAAPLFLWVHFFDPHAGYEAPDPWPSLFPGDPYAAEIATTDDQTGRLLAELRARRAGRARWVVVASDHGEGLHDHGETSHGALLHTSTIRVPIVVRGDVYAPQLSAVPVSLERVPATLLERVGLDPALNPSSAPPLEAPGAPVHSETLYGALNFGWGGLRAREEDGWRLVTGPVDRLYRMADDPGERHDLSEARPDVVARLKEGLEREWNERRRRAFGTEAREVSAAESEALQSLGYVAGGTAVAAADLERAFTEGVDPHTRMALFDRVSVGLGLFGEGRPEEAIETLQSVVREDPGNRFVFQQLGAALLQADRPREAREALRSALALGPNPDRVTLDLARAERALGNPEGERAALRETIARYPETVEARLELARSLSEDGELDAAASQLREVVAIRPSSLPAHVLLARIGGIQGNTDEAKRQWRVVLELDRGGPASREAERALEGLE